MILSAASQGGLSECSVGSFLKPRDAAARKCQSQTVLHFCVNSGQINSLKDGIIIKQRFDSSGLMAWPLKCRLSKH